MGSVERAVRRIRDEAGGQDAVDHGWPAVPHNRRPYLVQHGGLLSHRCIARLSRDAPVQRVQLSRLVATQESVGKDEALAYARDPGRKREKPQVSRSGVRVDLPLVVEWRGRQYVHDGHHRLFAAKMRGDRYAEARVIDADAEGLARWCDAADDEEQDE